MGAITALTASLGLLALLPATSGAVTNERILLNSFGAQSGEAGGDVRFGTGVAVNRAGVGGATAGDVYVSSWSNQRVEAFSASGTFVRAFGWDVVANGPSDTGANETQAVTVKAVGGSYALTVTTATAIGTTTLGSTTLTKVSGGLGAFRVGDSITGTGIPSNATVTCVSPSPSCTTPGTITISEPASATGDERALTARETTAPIGAAASPGTVESALGALPGVGGGNVTVTGGPGDAAGTTPYSVTFSGGPLAHDDIAQMTAASVVADPLTGGSPTGVAVATTVAGGGREVCQAASDACKAGVSLPAAGALANPEGISLDQATGNVFVASNGNRRIDVFSATGVFQGAFGRGVITGGADLEFCTTTCVAGVGGGTAGAFGTNGLTQAAITVAPDGHVYVGDRVNHRINEFAPALDGSDDVTGVAFLRAFGWGVRDGAAALQTCVIATGCQVGVTAGGANDGQFPTNTPTSVAVDADGSIYAVSAAGTCSAANPCRVQKFNADASFAGNFGPSSGECQTTWASGAANTQASNGVAIDPISQHVFVTRKTALTGMELCEFDGDGTLIDRSPVAPLATNGTGYQQIAFGAADRIYLNAPIANARGAIYQLGPVPPAGAAMRTGDPVTDVTSRTATFHGTVTIPDLSPAPATAYRFEYSRNGVTWSSIPETSVSVGDGNSGEFEVAQTAFGLAPNTAYLVRLVANTGPTTVSAPAVFMTGAAPPAVTDVISVPETNRVTLNAQVNPNGQPTSYRFEWGTTVAYGNATPVTFRQIGSGSDPISVQEVLVGLDPGTTYYYRLVAKNTGTTESGPHVVTTDGSDNDRRAELVSLPDNGGIAGTRSYIGGEMEFQVAPSGDEIFYLLAYGPPDATSDGMLRYKGTRTDAGWESTQLTPQVVERSHGDHSTQTELSGRHGFVADDLSCGVLMSTQPHTADAPRAPIENSGGNLFTRDASGDYHIVTSVSPSNATDTSVGLGNSAGNLMQYLSVDASQDCKHVVFRTVYRYPGLNGSGIYRSDAGVMSDLGVLPDGSSAPLSVIGGSSGTGSGGDAAVTRRAVSDDATRVFFTATSNDGSDVGTRALYLRDGSNTIKVSASKTSTGARNTMFQTASKTGSRVAFLANYGLTATSSSGPTATSCASTPPQPCALYVYDVDSGELTDISATSASANTNGATVAGVFSASNDLKRIYFAARAQLVPGEGPTYAQNVANEGYSVYLWDDGELRFVAPVTAEDVQASTRVNIDQAGQATANGGHLLFQSGANVTGADTGDVAEAYRYSASTGEVTCLSCRLDGEPSVDDTFSPMRTTANNEHERGRLISDDGQRAFFSTLDALTPDAIDGKTNIYAWERGAVRLLTTGDAGVRNIVEYPEPVLVGASPSGDDVFVSTPEALDPRDKDGGLHDLYGFRVGGGFPAPTPAPACDALGNACQAAGADAAEPSESTSSGRPEDRDATARGRVTIRPLSARQRTAMAAGRVVRIAVRTNRPGRVRLRGTARIGRLTASVLSRSRVATGAGWVELPVRLSRPARRSLRAGEVLRLKLTASFSKASRTVSSRVTLRVKPRKPGLQQRQHPKRATR